jgi:hypothetical protein
MRFLRLWISVSCTIAGFACASKSVQYKKNAPDSFDYSIDERKTSAIDGTCTVVIRIRQVKQGEYRTYTISSTKNTCEEAETDALNAVKLIRGDQN